MTRQNMKDLGDSGHDHYDTTVVAMYHMLAHK